MISVTDQPESHAGSEIFRHTTTEPDANADADADADANATRVTTVSYAFAHAQEALGHQNDAADARHGTGRSTGTCTAVWIVCLSNGLFASIHEALIFVLIFTESVPQFRPKYYPTRQSVAHLLPFESIRKYQNIAEFVFMYKLV